MKYKSEIYEAVHHDAVEMFRIGAICKDRMREYDKKCFVHEPETSPAVSETVAPALPSVL